MSMAGGIKKHEHIENIIHFHEPNVAIISETWFFKAQQIPSVKNYTFLTKNRSEIHRQAKVGSGRVGILLKDTLLKEFKIYEIVEQFESILCVMLKTTRWV